MGTTYDQLATTYTESDIPCQNKTGSTIAADTIVMLDATTNYIGDANGTTIPNIKLPVASGGDPSACFGVTLESIPTGQQGRVRTAGIARVTWYAASAGVLPGATVDATSHSGDAGKATTHTAAKASIGTAVSAGAVGDTILINVQPSLNA